MKWLRLWGFLMKMNAKPYILRPFAWSLSSGQCTLQGESARELTHASSPTRDHGQEPALGTLHSPRRVSSWAHPHVIMGTGACSHEHCTLQGESAHEFTHVRSWGQEPALRTLHSPRRVSSWAHPRKIMGTEACSHDTAVSKESQLTVHPREIMGTGACSQDSALSKESQLMSSSMWDHGDRSLLSGHCTLQGESARELTHVRSWGQEPALMTLHSPRRVSSRVHPREIMGTGACSHDTALSKESQLTSSSTWDHGDRSLLSRHCTHQGWRVQLTMSSSRIQCLVLVFFMRV